MNRNRKIIISIIVLLSIFILLVATSIALWTLNILSNPVYTFGDIAILLVLGGIIMFLFALFVNERKQIREIIKENDYNLHRKTTFYSYNFFTQIISASMPKLKNKKGYLIAFNAVRNAGNTTYTLNKAADYNGFISDYIVEVFNKISGKRGLFKGFYYCFYRGNFIFYIICQESELNNFINSLENKAYQISIEKDFRLYIQPSFGVYEHRVGKDDSVYDMVNKAIVAREVAEKNYETTVFFSIEMLKDTTSDEADEIASALENGEFVVYYQPKFNLASKTFISSEALIRWDSPTRGLLSPMRFIDTAENGGLIHRIDMYVFEQVCKDLDETRRKGRRLIPVSINFSLYEFYSPNFVEDIINTIEKYNINPALLELEILEGTTGVNLFLSISILKKIKEYGLRILMDDFGVGYSNFNNLKNLPIDVIKIDKSFIDNIEEDVKSREIAKFMIEFSKEIGLEVVAEGVDNQKQVDILKKFKCDTIQGFFYSKPLPRAEFEKFIANNQFEKKENIR